ncbi:hypothetical protein EJ06DRAFT_216751 [Trichodelitschia bisporula]|uniref:Uncharacterized protein n=1 Tax=Trichodelitschia bisporula TaxID=703511 RepID=A0A6G1I9Q5_9PEZI|nr:hypothetical protein EJ06DRAFT_216751 [Trichodelitschia bisporula]
MLRILRMLRMLTVTECGGWTILRLVVAVQEGEADYVSTLSQTRSCGHIGWSGNAPLACGLLNLGATCRETPLALLAKRPGQLINPGQASRPALTSYTNPASAQRLTSEWNILQGNLVTHNDVCEPYFPHDGGGRRCNTVASTQPCILFGDGLKLGSTLPGCMGRPSLPSSCSLGIS